MSNREIKFRAWDKKKKFMQDPQFYIFNGMWHGGRKSATCDLIVMQFTGLKDKNGKEIYEGDIMEIKSHGNEKVGIRRLVKFRHGCFLPFNFREEVYEWHDPCECTVIGNIYENPELLEVKDGS